MQARTPYLGTAAAAAALPLALAALTGAATVPSETPTPRAVAANVDRSPTDVALTPDGRRALTTNRTADSVSLVDLTTGKVLAETVVGDEPFAATVAADGSRALVTNYGDDSLSILTLTPTGATVAATVPVGDEPRGVAVSADGRTAFVALAGENAVAVVDLSARKVAKRWPVGSEPWHVALTPDGKRLAVGNSRSRNVTVLDTTTGKEAHTVRALCRNLRQLAVSPDGRWAYLPGISERGMAATRENIDRGWVVGNRLLRVPLAEDGPREALTLDTQGMAVGDVDGVAISPDGGTLALTAGGTHELLLLRNAPALPFETYGGPGDHLAPELRNNPRRFQRVALGGRPLGARFTPDGKQVVVANYLDNSVQVVDAETGTLAKTISLGGPATPSLARRGEAIFTDAGRSFNQWYSCSTCHTEGHTNGGNFDTFNDGSYGKPKKTLSLRGVTKTAPYTWHGWQKSLEGAVRESMVKSMQGPEPSQEDVDAVIAYLETLTVPKSPYPETEQSRRGAKVFLDKGCATCHGGPEFTSPIVVKVGLESPTDAYQGFNPPSLRGVHARAPYLHDGRARNLEEVMTEHHRPSELAGKPDCTPEELADLVAYLKTL
jgi:40-residue YVTN family beta-propeller repeat